jgi:hypothetical protein
VTSATEAGSSASASASPAKTAANPAASSSGGNGHSPAAPAKPTYNPLAPRLRASGAPLDRQERQARERDLKKSKARLFDLEKRISEKEKAVKDLEVAMASPGFYDDRARAEKAANDHKTLMWEVGDLMQQWEMVQAEVEEKESALQAAAR